MDSTSQKPLTTAEAKVRLRVAAQNITVGALINKGGWPLLGVAAVAGFIVARLRLSGMAGSATVRRTIPILLDMLLTRKKSD